MGQILQMILKIPKSWKFGVEDIDIFATKDIREIEQLYFLLFPEAIVYK